MQNRFKVFSMFAACMMLASASYSAVVVEFSMNDDNVVTVEWKGTLTIHSAYAPMASPSGSGGFTFGGDRHLMGGTDLDRLKFTNAGDYESTSLNMSNYVIVEESPIVGGFFQNSVYLPSEGVLDTQAQTRTLDFNGLIARFRPSGWTSLDGIGAGSFDNTLAWTARGTGDTITYQTVPEPASVALCCLGAGLALTGYRRLRRR